ncbi:hypothetical protein [Vagococcus luciliae]|uniref:Uncharacterized protein n=1 Tax=Vagococcus luciliae TaxID=2920380 RepID=A0ABY5NXA6_9ENTE|nr:hypothetical protein [Vagococcus luciliae]UUV98279.1 hypothetical protein G314FT_03710 [Vagococcus luciliae]
MPLEEFVIDVQLYQDETKKPTEQSVILLPVQNITTKKNQLLLKWSNRKQKLSQSIITKAVTLFMAEWEKTFSLYPVDRVFLDYTAHERIELLVTFDASRLYSNTQIRNIKTNAPRIFKEAMKEAYDQLGILEQPSNSQINGTFTGMDYDNYDNTQERVPSISQVISTSQNRHSQDFLDDGLLEKQQRIYELEQKIAENAQVIKSFELDLKTAQREYELKINQMSQENDSLKQKVISYQDNEIDYRQQLQIKQSEILDLKNNVNELNSSLEQGVESWKQRYQQAQYENEELRLVITENQQFEEQVQESLREATLKLKQKEDELANLIQENNLSQKESQLREQQLHSENERLQDQQDKLDRLLEERQLIIQQLTDELTHKEQEMKKLTFEHQQAVQEYQHQLNQKDKEFENINYSKNEEIKRLSQRLEKQQELVNQLMNSQELTQAKWQDNYTRLESNYRTAASRVFDLEKELAKLKQSNYSKLNMQNSDFSSISLENETVTPSIDLSKTPEVPIFDPVDMVTEENSSVESSDLEASPQIDLDDTLNQSYHYTDEDDHYDDDYDNEDDSYDDDYDDDYDYEDDDYDYDYDYEDDDYDDDYDYDYDEDDDYDDDILGYDDETIMDDVDSILSDTEDEEGKEKVRKKEFLAFESQLDLLSERWKKLDKQDIKFKKWAEPKMKQFDRFYKKLDENIKAPKLLSRKYVMTEEVWGEIQAYGLISRHLQTILDYED